MALLLVVVVAFVGLAVDGGHLYLTKTELQNAADACALSASQELAGAPDLAADAFARAEAAGLAVALRNRQGLQGQAIEAGQVRVRFSDSAAASASEWAADVAPGTARYARCAVRREGITPWFMQLVGVMPQAVAAEAVAALSPAQLHCGIPMAVCAKAAAGASPAFGLTPGQWISGRFSSGGGVTGSFNWVDYSPPMGGASELGQLLRGAGQCSLDLDVPVGQPGSLGNAAARAWNTRFGLYQSGSDTVSTAPPDFTGRAYTPLNWPSQSQALADFLNRRRANEPFASNVAQGNAVTGLKLSPGYDPVSTTAQHQAYGANRRLVVVPVIDCGDWSSGQTAPVRGWACMLMLHPVGRVDDPIHLEYAGLSSEPNSPCASSGVPGEATGAGPRVPVLVR